MTSHRWNPLTLHCDCGTPIATQADHDRHTQPEGADQVTTITTPDGTAVTLDRGALTATLTNGHTCPLGRLTTDRKAFAASWRLPDLPITPDTLRAIADLIEGADQ